MSDTQTIDDKKNDDSIQNKGSELVKFILTAIILVSFVIFYFCLGGFVLYACKLGQSNILPSEMKCFPYTDTKPNIESVLTNIFITFTDPQMSAKLNFPYDKYNSKNLIIDLFRDYKKEPKSNFLINYFISIIEALIGFNYLSINYILNLLNTLPEPIIVLFGPIFATVITTFIFIIDNFYLMYLWFAKMSWFFKTNSNVSDDHEPVWKDVTIVEPVNYFISVMLIILYFILFFVLLICLPVMPFMTLAWCIGSCLGFKSEMNNKSTNVLTVLRDLFKFYKVLVMGISSSFIVLSAFANFGVIAGLISIVSLCLIIWGIVSINIFKQIKPETLSEMVSNTQAAKTCSVKDIKTKKEYFPLYNWLFSQKGGKQFANELKKMGENLKNSGKKE